MPKPIQEMKGQELIEHMNRLRNSRVYAYSKGYEMMLTQIDYELEKAQARYDEVLQEEKDDFENMIRERRIAKGYDTEEPEPDDDHIVFETSEQKRDS